MREKFQQPLDRMISVIIPAYNEQKNIGKCLTALCKQTTKRPFEVIVVDNNSTDRTAAVAKKFEKRLRLRVIREKKKGRGAARATGFAHAKGDILFSTDADTIVPPDWIEAYARILQRQKNVIAVTGLPQIDDCTSFQNTMFNLTIPFILQTNVLTIGNPGLSGFSFAIRRRIYEEAGGFNPNTDAYEDLDLANRVSRLGTIVLDKRHPVTCSGRRFKHGLLRGWMEYTQTFVRKFMMKQERVILPTRED